ncbi:cobalamin biosynthesis protein CobW [Schaalia sp. 19OD2882]|uniref:GTP-binding protein n=1 Tax=Schaalia sp. 19OD2882 TaxID=2794089 RepID=UPI001C1EE270|nr:GTP-binding protein [Schaalia sp. 19OD2882]QWW20395.1 cobalamin biosynthesis protein CobW [Schaalia sp. 19OD2882]
MLLSVLSTTDPLVRDLAALAASDCADLLTCDFDEDDAVLRLTRHGRQLWEHRIPLAHPCLTCSLREAVVPALVDMAHGGTERLTLCLPTAVEPVVVVPLLAGLTQAGEALEHCEVTTCVHAISQDNARRDLLTHTPLSEVGLALFEDDTRCTGEVLMTSLGYADVLLSIGEDELGGDLVEHLRPFDTLRLDHLDQVTADVLFVARHDVERAIERVHPASTSAWGGPTTHGVWTLDLHSERPFHPERLLEFATDLAAGGTCARGCFWLPSRPDTICTWEVNGGSASVGTAGGWETSAHTHIVVTGTGEDGVRERVEAAFSNILMTEAEMPEAFVWIGADDGLSHWFPDEED